MNSSRSTHLLVCSNHPFFQQWHSSSGRYVMYGNLIGQLETRHVTASKFQYTPGSLLPHIKPVWYDGAKLGSKSYVAQHIFFARNLSCRRGSFAQGECCRSKLSRVYRPLKNSHTIGKENCTEFQKGLWWMRPLTQKSASIQNGTWLTFK